MPEITIRLLLDGQEESSPAGNGDRTPADFGGQVPCVGDFVIDPGVPTGQDRRSPEIRTIYEVVRRYWGAGGDGNSVALIVRDRPGYEEESPIFGS